MDGIVSVCKHALWVVLFVFIAARGFDSYDKRTAIAPKNYDVVAGKCVEVLDK